MPHHVVLRGNNRRRLFSFPREYQYFIYLLGVALAASRTSLHAAVLMVNHVHLLVTPSEAAGLSRFVKRVAQRYAQRRNQIRKASGRLFEERFFSVPVADPRHLAIATAYIELNPVRGGLVASAREYRWSTYRLHTAVDAGHGIPARMWTPSEWYLGLSADPLLRATNYADWVADCRLRDVRPEHLTVEELEQLREEEKDRGRFERPDRSCAL